MGTITLEQIHDDILDLKRDVNELKKCFHEDLLELSDETKSDLEQSRQEIKAGKFIRLEDLKP